MNDNLSKFDAEDPEDDRAMRLAVSLKGPRQKGRIWQRLPLSIRFWSQVDRSGSCWIWTGSLSAGYGELQDGNKRLRVHRLSYELTHGPIQDGLFVCHKCDNPPCCNPDHLFVGTSRENTHDMLRKGRHKGSELTPRGEHSPHSKLTEAQAKEIKTLSGRCSTDELAKRFGVSRGAINNIQASRSWKHLRTTA